MCEPERLLARCLGAAYTAARGEKGDHRNAQSPAAGDVHAVFATSMRGRADAMECPRRRRIGRCSRSRDGLGTLELEPCTKMRSGHAIRQQFHDLGAVVAEAADS